MRRDGSGELPLPIDHSRIMDGFQELARHASYVAFETFCGICDIAILATAFDQKHLLEAKGVPVKALRRGALFCRSCRTRRARIRELRKRTPRRDTEEFVELRGLEAEEAEARRTAGRRYETARWPYGFPV